MGLTKDIVRQALSTVPTPSGEGNLVSSESLLWVAACDGFAAVKLQLKGMEGPAGEPARTKVAEAADRAVRIAAQRAGVVVDGLSFQFVNHAGTTIQRFGSSEAEKKADDRSASSLPQAGTPEAKGAMPGVKHAIAVGAGKGGVGKSTVSVNLAVGLARQGYAVGLLDGDIYGPSMPTMLGLDTIDQTAFEGKLVPFHVHGIKAITIGKLVERDKPLIWRGPMAHGAFKQLVDRTEWGTLDYLIIDLPPGTGDVPLTMAQSLQLTGAVVVCTPQKVAQDDAARAAAMFTQLGVDVLGVVENMSYFVGDDGTEYDLFGRGGAEKMAQRLGLPFLGSVPITMALRQNSDTGEPTKNFDKKAKGGDRLVPALNTLVTNLENQVSLASLRQGTTKPTLSIS